METLDKQDQSTPPVLNLNQAAPPADAKPSKPPVSEARLRANRQNAKNSTGPKTEEGKRRSCLNATRHGILSQVIHVPQEEMATCNEFTSSYVASLSPVGAVEAQLANACADLQFRLHRLAAGEHNLFAIGFDENGNRWNTGHPESHTALTFAETLRRSKDPLATITLYETRLSRRFLQTLKQLREMQAERQVLEQQQLAEMYQIASRHPAQAETLDPDQFGFVCSKHAWKLYFKRKLLLTCRPRTTSAHSKRLDSHRSLRECA